MGIKKVLIANRGEITCRIIKTLRKMNISSVAIYSEADSNSLYVQMADESILIGPAPSIQSYLNINAICNAVLESKSDAVHPGFGFLSENWEFAQRLKEIGVHFIGPGPEVIKSMGDKIEAKKIALQAGVSVVKGYACELNAPRKAIKNAQDIGFPVIIKAAAGGGGKGMRVANSPSEVEEALMLASIEAAKSFGDSRVFLEKYIERPRHIEIQVLADKSGNVICLGERECSIQRRYQKVVEEAPSCFITEEVRKKMYQQSIILAKKVGYHSAGTVEFIMGQNKNFYFLEMNTRIQVEHPVTELVTGIDLVQEMINIEEGREISIKQNELTINGHAIEVRIYAEDPSNNFLPSSGVITDYIADKQDNVRIDTGVSSGSQVTMFYDPMLAKICSHGANRAEAIFRMKSALRNFYILGVENNVSFLQSIISHPEFISGNLYTGFINDFYPEGFNSDPITQDIKEIFIAVPLYIHLTNERRNNSIFNGSKLEDEWVVEINNHLYEAEINYDQGGIKVTIDNNNLVLRTTWNPGDVMFFGNINDKDVIVKLNKTDLHYVLECDGRKACCKVYRAGFSHLLEFMRGEGNQENNDVVLSPITGMLSKIYVTEGEEVKSGQPLFIIETMKMENTFYSKAGKKIFKIRYAEGESVNTNDVVIEYYT